MCWVSLRSNSRPVGAWRLFFRGLASLDLRTRTFLVLAITIMHIIQQHTVGEARSLEKASKFLSRFAVLKAYQGCLVAELRIRLIL